MVPSMPRNPRRLGGARPLRPIPTLRDIAQRAGISAMAVSLALRGARGVSAETRTRVRALAAELGYRPDPSIARLMAHLRQGNARVKAALCILSPALPAVVGRGGGGIDASGQDYVLRQVQGARQRAMELGYSTLVQRLDVTARSRPDIDRILAARGIEGVIVLPTVHVESLDAVLDWTRLAAVATTFSVPTPAFHRVVPDQFGNIIMACERLVALGFRRIGLFIAADTEQRVRHHYTAAAMWHGHYAGGESVEPLIDRDPEPAALRRWVRWQRPDVIVTDAPELLSRTAARAGAALPKLVTMHESSQPDDSRVIGSINQRPALIGATAVDVLTGMLHRGEKGVPTEPIVSLVRGAWLPRSGQLSS